MIETGELLAAAAEGVSLEHLKALMHLLPVGVILVEGDSPERAAITHTNQAFERLVGATVQVGATARTLPYRWFRADHETPVAAGDIPALKVIASNAPVTDVELHVRHPDGRWRTVLASASPVRARGRVIGAVTVVQDITERKRAEEAAWRREAQLRALIENVSAGVALIDEHGRFSLYNKRFLALFGLAADSTIHNVNDHDWSAWQVFDEDGRLLHVDEHPVRRAALTRQPVRNQLVSVRSPARRDLLWMVVSAEPLFDAQGRLEHIICTYHDVSERRRTEEVLREADRRKDEFLALLSHELRNPLTPILHSLYLLDRAPPGSDQARRAHAIIGRQVGHLTRLTDDLLDATRIARGKIQVRRERVELGELVKRTVDDHRPLFATRDVALEWGAAPVPLWIVADPTRIAQAVGNLLQNASKFTPEGGRVHAELALEHGAAVLRVRDTGLGITPDMMGRLFEPFSQADRTLDRSRGGLGLGLALVKGLVEIHGGTVTATSDGPGRGSTFTVKLPVDATVTAQAPTVADTARPGRRRVLVIEDNVDAADSLRDALELGEHEVAVAYDGRAGLARVRELRPDVVLCDIGLPLMDGYQVARAVRADDTVRDVFLVALTGYALAEDVARATEAGFDRHLAKPPSLEKLEDVLTEVPRLR